MSYIYISIVLYLIFATYKNWNPIHPIVWYTPFIILYSFSVVFLHYSGYHNLKNPTEVSLIGLLSVMSGIFFMSISDWWVDEGNLWLGEWDISVGKASLNLSLYGVLFLSIIYMWYVYTTGVSSKPELLRSNIIYLGVIYGVVNTFSLLKVLICVRNKDGIPFYTVGVTLITFIGALLILGQRDFIFRYMIGLVVIFYSYGICGKIVMYFLGIIMISMVPIMGTLKSYLLSQDVSRISDNIFVSVFSGEFMSAGRNIDTLVLRSCEWNYKYGKTLITDVMRAVVPAPIYKFQNPTNWFRNQMHPELASQGKGPGFTLAGEGFINFGYIGIPIWFMLVSLTIVYLYKKRRSSMLLYLIYISSIPIFIYSLRADIANIISPILKHVAVPLLMMSGLSYVLRSTLVSYR
ncbi:hypothetical protein GGP51_003227 [Salinibacter ruber]|uniref:O-antigen polysaccharide polymerase Wzy n=2 Tax=Salinibacter ruber TaxID=146919 RepID=UPI0021671679|nr:O-antigen polysaccharide polymerase Wzy [Salinibacter ruber]MCS3642192.1 hypothetical protein [Salinibacter ruber]MCS4191730.1 hypothetical protein [Salinibacter ruber]